MKYIPFLSTPPPLHWFLKGYTHTWSSGTLVQYAVVCNKNGPIRKYVDPSYSHHHYYLNMATPP